MQDGIELDFISDRFLGEQFLIECKYNAELNEKQQALFDSLGIAKKFVLNGYDDLKILETVL